MGLCHYLAPQCIALNLNGATKEDLLKNATAFLAKSNNLGDPAPLFSMIWDREQSASTFLPMGIAVPHARYSGVEEIKLSICLLKHAFPNPDDPALLPIQVFCIFVSPTKESEFSAHLKLLSQIAAVFEDTEFTEKLVKSKTADEAFHMLQQRERSLIPVS